MLTIHYCKKVCRGIDQDDLTLIAATVSWTNEFVEFEFIPVTGDDADDELVHAHFTAPIS